MHWNSYSLKDLALLRMVLDSYLKDRLDILSEMEIEIKGQLVYERKGWLCKLSLLQEKNITSIWIIIWIIEDDEELLADHFFTSWIKVQPSVD